MRPRRHLTINQHLAIAKLKTGCSQREVSTMLRVSSADCNRETGSVTGRHRSGDSLATSHADDRFILNSILLNWMMNTTQLQARLSKVRAMEHFRWTRNQWLNVSVRLHWTAAL
uniref:Uncharacterized protein n=1 Tax=Mola mola TaxID=94237 RepID=A0A3Q3WPP8_MOLML